tara:strand:- start:459 stop:665 length:207 start_codon:yes stop_codon:yes gene_type:complete
MTDDVISIKEFKAKKEQQKWKKVLDALEENVEAEVTGVQLNAIEKKGYHNFKKLITALRKTHVEKEEG